MKALKAVARFLGYIWASPLTLIGFLLAWGGSATYVKHDDDWCFYFKAERDGYAWKLFELLEKGAFTTGHVIILKHIEYLRYKDLIVHEKRHSAQAMVFGILMPVLYYGCMPVLMAMGKDPYEDNPFEIDANRAEAKAA